QFIAWDTFKKASVRSRIQDKKSVPSVLRKIFVRSLIRENAEPGVSGKETLFDSLIPPEFARQGPAYISWFTGILPQLGYWFEKMTGRTAASAGAGDAQGLDFTGGLPPGDDRDLFTLFFRYRRFLDANGLFEPAWEKPPFDDNGKECFIFFPESLSDFKEYEEILNNANHVTIVKLDENDIAEKPERVFFYTNSRSEITEAALYIRALVEREKTAWENIAVSIPDTENYEPYVLREFAARNIPVVHRTGKPLSSYPAGRFFPAVADCYSANFSFDSVVSLLLNRHLPWKDGEAINQLVEFGIKNNCICSWNEDRPVDVWLDAFASPAGNREKRAEDFYRALKEDVIALNRAASFAELRKRYFVFRGHFLDMENCLPETDLVLSRCISELIGLIEIERSFPDVRAPDPYRFLVDHLKETSYLPQEKTSGVSILPYRTAAPAPFDCHIILGSSQDNLTAVFSRLNFLPRKKREMLGVRDDDASRAFIDLHRFNSFKPAVFFCAQDTFSGYAIPHNYLGVLDKPQIRCAGDAPDAFAEDIYRDERLFCAALQSGDGAAGLAARFPDRLHSFQAVGFAAWSRRRRAAAGEDPAKIASDRLLALIGERYGGGDHAGQIRVSASAMKPYYECALRWLFGNVLSLESVRMEAAVMAENVLGSVYHAVLDCFFKAVQKQSNGVLADAVNGELPPEYRGLLADSVSAVFDGLPRLPGEQLDISALTVRFLKAQRQTVLRQLEIFAAALLRYFGGFRVLGSELTYTADEQEYCLFGKIDCLLEDVRDDSERNSELVIADFKLNSTPDKKPCTGQGENGLENFQLPMYITLAEKNGGGFVGTALFFSIMRAEPNVIFGSIRDGASGKEKAGIGRTGEEDDPFELILSEFRAKAAQYAEEAASGSFTTISASERKCVQCVYHRVCRTVYAVGRERDLFDRLNSAGPRGAGGGGTEFYGREAGG
ncbi:MAG: PD-(D/E)XK nuclease family protein, partial [Treponema sp.]|nr:PD-(D/E)XK nuclease family protein [Treponema sp.]